MVKNELTPIFQPRREDPALSGMYITLYCYAEQNPLTAIDPSGLQLDSVTAAVKRCLELPTPALQIKCLDDLIGVGKDAAIKVAKCCAIHKWYTTTLGCKGCRPGMNKGEARRNATCLAQEVFLRKKYLDMKCDYILPGSIKVGSAAQEKGHQIEAFEKGLAIANCFKVINSK